MADHLIIFDTTLRDGEQSPGASMTKEEKMRIARQLERLRVDVIEAGFPASSNGDWEAVHDIARAIKESTVCGLARANENDVVRCGEAVKPAKSQRIHTFIATSPIHMQMKLKMSPEQVLEQAVKAVTWARRYTDNVEFSPEDAGRSDSDFLCRVIEAVINMRPEQFILGVQWHPEVGWQDDLLSQAIFKHFIAVTRSRASERQSEAVRVEQ